MVRAERPATLLLPYNQKGKQHAQENRARGSLPPLRLRRRCRSPENRRPTQRPGDSPANTSHRRHRRPTTTLPGTSDSTANTYSADSPRPTATPRSRAVSTTRIRAGFYAGTWASNISWLRDGAPVPAYRSGGSLEWDFYGGWKPTFGDFTLDLGTLYYWYPGDASPAAAGAPGNPKANTWEIYVGGGWKWLTAKFSYSIDDKTFAVLDARGTWYFDLTATVPLGDFAKELTGLNIIAHWGKQKFSGTDPRTACSSADNDSLYQLRGLEDRRVVHAAQGLHDRRVLYRHLERKSASATAACPEGGVYPRNIAKGTGTVYLQKTF